VPPAQTAKNTTVDDLIPCWRKINSLDKAQQPFSDMWSHPIGFRTSSCRHVLSAVRSILFQRGAGRGKEQRPSHWGSNRPWLNVAGLACPPDAAASIRNVLYVPVPGGFDICPLRSSTQNQTRRWKCFGCEVWHNNA